jgi:FemAB-related protein (PEP-CTERM system-associated)
MVDPEIRILDPDEPGIWPEDLIASAGFSATDSWSGYIKQVYDIPVYRLEACQNKRITGLLVLFWIRHPLFGNYLTTAPFASYGGFSFSSVQARNALLEKASSLSRDLGADYVVVRFNAAQGDPPSTWQPHPIYATYLVDLVAEPEVLLASYSSNHRNHIRRSQKRGFFVRFGHLELLDHAYDVLARSMQELGSPYHSKTYLRAMAESLGEKLEFAVVYDKSGSLVGSGVFIFHGQVVTNLHANILRKYRSDYAGEFFYWSLIEHYGQKGLKTFDLGRSLMGSGNEIFKLKWNPDKKTLAYWYFLPPGKNMPELNQKNPKFQLAIAIWKHLPFPIVRYLGPSLIRGLA